MFELNQILSLDLHEINNISNPLSDTFGILKPIKPKRHEFYNYFWITKKLELL